MKNSLKIASVILIVILFSLFTGCAAEKKLTGNLKDIVAKVSETTDFSSAEFVYSDEERAEDIIYGIYGVEDSSILEDYVISLKGEGKATSLAIFRFKEKVDYEAFKEGLKTYYVEGMYSALKLYIPDQYQIAENHTFSTYNNAIALIIYDNDGNKVVSDIIDTFVK
ncbi:MAG: hypothetical protein K0S55_1728 [Clostridia bacterium]|nr:hypothetical protein [Clostridia bacterium]